MLHFAHKVVAPLGNIRNLHFVLENDRMDKNHQVGFLFHLAGRAEQHTQYGDITEYGGLLLYLGFFITDKPPEHQYLTVTNQGSSDNLALVGHQVDGRSRGITVDALGGLFNFKGDRIAPVDTGGNLEGDANILALYGGKRIVGLRSRAGSLAGHKRHVLSYQQ